jgi:hypothetical protein
MEPLLRRKRTTGPLSSSEPSTTVPFSSTRTIKPIFETIPRNDVLTQIRDMSKQDAKDIFQKKGGNKTKKNKGKITKKNKGKITKNLKKTYKSIPTNKKQIKTNSYLFQTSLSSISGGNSKKQKSNKKYNNNNKFRSYGESSIAFQGGKKIKKSRKTRK